MQVKREKRLGIGPRQPRAAGAPELLTIARPELLDRGSDGAFRALVHRLLTYARQIETIRDGFGALAGLSGVQYEIMMSVDRLADAAGVTVGTVAAWLHLSGAFVTIETGRLVARGLLQKSVDARDRRRVRLSLTPAGRRTLAALAPRQRQVNDVLFASLNARDFQALSRILRGLVPCGDRAVHLIQFILMDQHAATAEGEESKGTYA